MATTFKRRLLSIVSIGYARPTLAIYVIKNKTGARAAVHPAARLRAAGMADDDVKEARARANALRDSLPQSVDAAALGVRDKAPFQLLCTREALIWRTEELARTACDALERDDFAAAALLAARNGRKRSARVEADGSAR